MSGVELLPFVWALPVAYIAASYGMSKEHQQGPPSLALPGHLSLDGGHNEPFPFDRRHNNGKGGVLGDDEAMGRNNKRFPFDRRRNTGQGRVLEDDEAIEVSLTSRGGCACFLA